MTNNSAENAALIKNLQVMQQEIAIEGDLQLASMLRVFSHHIPLYIEKLRRLEELENGKAATGASKEAVTISNRLHQPGHSAVCVWSVPNQG